ncbi:hypothetical protein [Sphingomonas sp. M1-B02]|uniref:hypothetical protein n=1 Tax=Sphingomonas sp. M1-B02 TaxID=3114300 RepID=UPI003FA77EE1
MVANDASNTIVGNGGSDNLSGLGGNDTYVVSTMDTVVMESVGEGIGTVIVQA